MRELVSRAKKLGMDSLALTDTNRMSGLILFYNECIEQGIKPILGAELTEPGQPYKNIVLLARNAEGYGDICEIITKRHLKQDIFSFRQVFEKQWGNLFFLTSFPDLLTLLCNTPNRDFVYAELIHNSPASRSRSKEIEMAAKALGRPVVASNDSYFLDKKDWDQHRILRAISLNSTLSRLKTHEYASEDSVLATQAQMRALFADRPQAIDNASHLALQCNVDLSLGKWIMPEIEVPQGHTPTTYLRQQAMTGLELFYANSPNYSKAKEIQEMELEVISKLGYDSYFLMVKQIKDWANEKFKTKYRKPGNSTVLRGSAANSITFYNLGVSRLEPIRYNLYFQRFLNEDRASPPDADLDFGWDERDEVFEYVTKQWGRDRVAMICTTNHFRKRAAFRETAKVFGYSEEQISELIDNELRFWRHGFLDDFEHGSPTPPPRSEGNTINDAEIHKILQYADAIVGKPHFLGQHPGGLVVTNDPIWRHVACEYSGGEKNRIITQIDMHNGIDDLGLIKFDLLGNGSLSVLRDTLKQLEEQGLPDPQVWNLEKCYDDPKVKHLLRNGRTRGIFYIESPAQIRLNRKIQAESFDEVAITSSLVRPAGTAYADVFIERHRKHKIGIRDWEFIHPALEPILGETHDVCAFQEDVIKICHLVAGLTFKKADKIRKMMNSLHEGIPEGWDKTAREFLDGCMHHSGLNQAQALELWKRVGSFTGFSFCKSHSASYAQLSFQCAYLKCHYPSQFLSAVISNRHGFYTADVYLDEARRWGLRILPMDINSSRQRYWGKHDWIRPGFMHVRNMSEKSMAALVNEREKNGRFQNLVDFVERVQIGKQETVNLIKVGAFDAFGLNQPELIALLDGIYGRTQADSPRLFPREWIEFHPGLKDYPLVEKCLNELRLLGFMITGNILDILDLHPASRNSVPAAELHRYKGRRVKVFGRPITQRTYLIRNGKFMQFLTLEDRTECMDIVFWPSVFERYGEILHSSGPFEIWGKVTEDWGTYSLEADWVRAVAWNPGQIDFTKASRRLEQSRPSPVYAEIEEMKVA